MGKIDPNSDVLALFVVSWGKKVKILGLHGDEHQKYNGKNGAIMGFDPATGRYSVKLGEVNNPPAEVLGKR